MKQVPRQQATAPTFEVMKKVVKFAAEEQERAKRLVFFGLAEGEKEGDEARILTQLWRPSVSKHALTTKRLGARKQGYNHPV